MQEKYLDIQVNGYGGIDYNRNDLTLEGLRLSCNKLKEDKVAGIFATIITAKISDMLKRIRNLVEFKKNDPLVNEIIKGIHIEGPFINNADGYRGAHEKKYILKPDKNSLKNLVEASEGHCKIVTLAPEMDKKNSLIEYLRSENIEVSAGHSNASLNELKNAIAAGLSMFTHLGNGCPQNLPRHDNIIQRVLSLNEDLKICFIADGLHVPFYALKNYLNCAGTENCIITTDAMAASGANPGKYTLGSIELEVKEDGVVRQPGKSNFAGSSVDMKTCAFNLRNEIGLPQEDVERLTFHNAKQLFKI